MTLEIIDYIEEDKVVDNIKKKAEEHGYKLTGNEHKIAKAKLRFFGIENWEECPCHRNCGRSCISKICKEDIERDGVCGCNLYLK